MDIIEKLTVYKDWLFTAYYANYIRLLTSGQVKELNEIAKELGLEQSNNCPSCLLKLCKTLGRYYFTEINKEKKSNEEKRTCPICGKELQEGKKYCSRECFQESMKKKKSK